MTKPAIDARVAAEPADRRDRRPWLWPVVTLVLVAGLGGVWLWSGPAPMSAPWDVFILLDGAYRMTGGQVPSTDFENPIGPLVYGLVSLGMKVQAVPSLTAVVYAGALFLAITAPLAWFVARRRLPAVHAAGFTVFLALLVVTPRPLGYSPWTTTYAMLYNRYGWVLYATLLLLVLIRPRAPLTTRRVVAEGLVLGFLLGLMFYCKANFFAAGAAAVVVGLVLGTLPRNLRFGAAAVAAFLGVAVVMRLTFGIGIAGYLADLVHAGGSQGGQRLGMLMRSAAYTAPVLLLTAAVVVALILRARRLELPSRPILKTAVAAGYVWVSSVLVASANTAEHGDLPALVVLPLLLLVVLAPKVRTPALVLAGVAVLVAATAGPIAGKDTLALGRAASEHGYVAAPPASQRMAAPGLRDFVVPADAQWQTAYRTANAVPAMINDGVALLRRHAGPADTVATIALANPFSFALSLPPATGGPLWWDVGISFDRSVHPDADRAFGNVDWVMIPRLTEGQGCCAETVTALREVYGAYLAEHFTEAEITADWILLARTR
ncbi:hypothetical protein L1857_05235 [Amycolatopsis thermalba]|uniref:Transmembrane protein n=1 Tax=Amycolatopsis thermalba TaxID=944492 RepID=A0ABY4NNT2_9PSEU|nr:MULTISPECIES: hypothetical protein [Amycolatopsis]UQS22269.1 hypothetical protein L1857_05235 [Amycolatopsis thermalba]